LVVLAGVIATGGLLFAVVSGQQSQQHAVPVLSFRIGKPFVEVVRESSYPVLRRAGNPGEREDGFGWTDITEPVILCFNDPVHGFILPPTKFAALTYQHNTAAMVATSPMLDKLPFNEAVAVLENLQNQFKGGGWEPYKGDDSEWFDLTPEGRKRLYARMFEPGYAQEITLRVPKKYGMTFRIKCAEGCWTREPPYKFLIDVGVGDDTEGWERGHPNVWEKSHPAYQAPAGSAQPACIPGRNPTGR
jgi:hypothetical protein